MQTLSNSLQLRRKIDLVLPRLMQAGQRIMSHPQVAELYPEYLFTLHTMVRASVPLMETALRRCETQAATDPVCAAMVSYLEQHIKEERYHDIWLLEDQEALGCNRAEALKRVPSPTVAAMVGSQYYWIEHYHPVALLGYIAVMEGYPPSPAQLEEQLERTGLPRAAFRSLFKHAQLDPYHRNDLNDFLDSLALDSELVKLLGLSSFRTIALASQALEEVLDRHASPVKA